MKVKLDENMPQALAELLRSAGHDVSTVHQENISGVEDAFIIKKASEENRLLITFDLDFGDVRRFPVGSHYGVKVFRLHDQRWDVLKVPAQRLIASGLMDRLQKGLAVVDEKRIRIRSKEKQ